MKQLNNQRYSIVKKHLLSDFELKELSWLAELNDTAQEELDDESGLSAKTPNVLVDKPLPVCRELANWHLDPRQNVMDHLPTEQGQRSYFLKLRYKITDGKLPQTNLALETIPAPNITETNTLIQATIKTLYSRALRKKVLTPNTPKCWRGRSSDWDQMSANSMR